MAFTFLIKWSSEIRELLIRKKTPALYGSKRKKRVLECLRFEVDCPNDVNISVGSIYSTSTAEKKTGTNSLLENSINNAHSKIGPSHNLLNY